MTNNDLLSVIEGIKANWPEDERDSVSIAYSGSKVEYEGEVWYEITVADGTFQDTNWYALLPGNAPDEVAMYEPERLDPSDRIPEIDAKLA